MTPLKSRDSAQHFNITTDLVGEVAAELKEKMCRKETQCGQTYALCILDDTVGSTSTGDIQRVSHHFLPTFKPSIAISITPEQKDLKLEETSRTTTSRKQPSTTSRCQPSTVEPATADQSGRNIAGCLLPDED
ncbi:unnamed protein product [Macrosiphum euphorbiae]|uniref:Uncharacterized protein n=1 Tax=Macrosiphum euphorbiae TaxID=13131 RepID=A0AAV0WIF2_9HEMI|nr:unnamed protein product [Macrosiphum euphorbiae]